MKLFLSLAFVIALPFATFSQEKMERTLKRYNKESVPYVNVTALHEMDRPVTLDTRKKEEYEVSHLKDALWVGFKSFDITEVTSKIKDKDTEIIVYCSIGVRSENIGEKLQDAGYTNVKNLYGGIFEWKNEGYPVYDSIGNETEKVHAFSKHWGKLLTKGEKIYGEQ